MEVNGQQVASACFAVAIVSLLWVYRRTILRSRPGGSDSQDRESYAARRLAARQQIGLICARESLLTYRKAMLIMRRSELNSLQLSQLQHISDMQMSRRQD